MWVPLFLTFAPPLPHPQGGKKSAQGREFKVYREREEKRQEKWEERKRKGKKRRKRGGGMNKKLEFLEGE